MRSDKSIIKVIFKGLVFTKKEIDLITSVFHKVEATKGTVLLNQGDISDSKYYIYSGCVRAFHIDSHGKEYTVQFGIKDWWICDFAAFFTSEKAIMSIEAIQDSIIYKLSKKDKDYLYDSIPKIDRFFRIKLERSIISLQKRILAELSQSAKNRYINFINTYPNIEKIVKNYHIASYLGITTESLSRIRKEI